MERAEVLELQGQRGAVLKELRAGMAKKAVDPSELALHLVDEGLRNGERTDLEEAISICNSADTRLAHPLPARRCSLIAMDAAFFLKQENEASEGYKNPWGVTDAFGLSDEDRSRFFALVGYVVTRRYESPAEGRDLFIKAEDVAPANTRLKLAARVSRGYAAAAGENFKEALTVYTQLAQEKKDAALWLSAWIDTATGKVREAEQILRSLKTDTAGLHRALGLTYFEKGNLSQAKAEFLRAITKEDTAAGRDRTYLYLAITALESKDAYSARKHLLNLLKTPLMPLPGQLPGATLVLGTNLDCPESFSERYATLGLAWQPKLCENQDFLKQRIAAVQRELGKTPKSVELRDELFLLYEIDRYWQREQTVDYKAETKLLDEAAEFDRRDSINAPGLSRLPARRYIDKAMLALDYDRADDARRALWHCVHWYTGNYGATLWFLEVTAVLDEMYGVSPPQEKYPAFYVPSLYWPQITIMDPMLTTNSR